MKETHQEQIIAVRRGQILDAAAAVFADKGFHATTIRDIARAAGIADGTIYNYFENKTALLLGIFDRMRENVRIDVDVSALDLRDVGGFLGYFIRQPLSAMRGDNFELFRVVMSELLVNRDLRALYYQQVMEPTLALARPLFEAWIAQGLIRPVDVDLALRAVSGMMMGLILGHILGDPALDATWDEVPAFLTDLILHGLEQETP
jgi:TetR/AcrR family fatty acid metabolism transcriptional regulator